MVQQLINKLTPVKKYVLLFIVGLSALFALGNPGRLVAGQSAQSAEQGFQLYLTDLVYSNYLSDQYSCYSGGVSPPVMWKESPAGTQSYVLTVVDYDVVKLKLAQEPFVHWLVYDIPTNISSFPVGTPSVITGINSSGKTGFAPFCPPGHQVHSYFFNLYALDIPSIRPILDPVIGRRKAPNFDQLVESLHGHVIGVASLVARYQLPE